MAFQSFKPHEYIMIDVANNFGLDDLNWDDRISWFKDNESQLESLIKKAEEPALFYAGIKAWDDYKNGRVSHYPISLDATSSGIQFLACLTGDRKAAKLCNVVDTGKREDAYTKLYELMVSSIGESAKIDRKHTKRSIMTSFYGSTAIPKEVFGEGKLLEVFYETMQENAPGAWELNETMLAIWDNTRDEYSWVMPDNFHVHIKVMGSVTETINFLNEPFDVTYSVNMPIDGGRSLGANTTHSVDGFAVREIARRCMYNKTKITYLNNLITSTNFKELCEPNKPTEEDKYVKLLWNHYKKSGFLSARILDYLNESNLYYVDGNIVLDLIESLPEKPFQVASIHDCFRVLPKYGNDLRKQYNLILSEIARSDLLSYLMSQILGRHIPVQKIDKNLWKDILSTNYALS